MSVDPHAPLTESRPASSPQARPPAWDLSDLYRGLDDPAIQGDFAALMDRARDFEARYRGRIAREECTVALLREALDEYDSILRGRALPLTYAGLMFSADTADPARGALLQRLQVQSTGLNRHLLFFPLELGRLPQAVHDQAVQAPLLSEYAHYLTRVREEARFQLTEPEEQILSALEPTGPEAWERLASEITSRLVYRVRIGDETREMTQSQVQALFFHPDRSVRKAACSAITESMRAHSHVLTYIYNTLLEHGGIIDRLRGYQYPEESRHRSNELDPEVVQTVVDVCVEGYDVSRRWYALKRRLLGLPGLDEGDRYAPIGEDAEEISFDEARGLVLSAFENFSPEMRRALEPFFTRRWIDAEIRASKRGGAFCSYSTPDRHPYVFLNYTSRARDVMTLAHELGHALHGILARDQRYLSFYPSLPLAETASVFAEMLVFEELQKSASEPAARLGLLAGKIEDTLSTVFRQASIYRFEQQAHRVRREEGELTTERYNALWNQSHQEMFGDSLTLSDQHGWWWLYVPHIFGAPFYVYAYSFGELLVLSLYAHYRREGAPFVERYFDLLRAGGSRPPAALLADMGLDIRDPAFWRGGVRLIREMVEQAEQLAEEAGGLQKVAGGSSE